MKIVVKTPKQKQDIEVGSDSSVKEFREQVSKIFSAPVEQLCLIFAGKILKDDDKLSTHGIKDGLTVHLVIKSANKSQEQAAARAQASPAATPTPSTQPAPNIQDTPLGLGNLGGIPGMGQMGMGSVNFMDMQQRMQRELMTNPDMLQSMMDNPLVQQLMGNPEVMRQMIMSNPQMRELMERNPEISHMLNNPELMRHTMELARNPAMMQELMRQQDRVMSNLESMPGGSSALHRMYRDVHEPMMNAAQETIAGNPFAALSSSGSNSTSNTQQGRENTDPLPNPWGGSSTGSSTGTSTGTSTGGTGGSPAGGQIFNTPGMQSLLSQMTQNPQLMQNMMQAPYTQAMLQSFQANPELAQQIISSNPMFAGNPQLQEQMRQQLPAMLQQMANPEVQNLMTNQRALQAIMQIQQGMQTLQTEAPNLLPGLGIPGLSTPTTTIGSTATGTTTAASTSSPRTTEGNDSNPTSPASGTSSTSNPTSPAAPPTGGTGNQPDALSNFMAQMMSMVAQGQHTQAPEERYASQLDQLAAMGFVNRDANIQALIAEMGDVNKAIDRLLQQR